MLFEYGKHNTLAVAELLEIIEMIGSERRGVCIVFRFVIFLLKVYRYCFVDNGKCRVALTSYMRFSTTLATYYFCSHKTFILLFKYCLMS